MALEGIFQSLRQTGDVRDRDKRTRTGSRVLVVRRGGGVFGLLCFGESPIWVAAITQRFLNVLFLFRNGVGVTDHSICTVV